MQFHLQISTVFYSEKTYFRFSYSSILDRLIENLFLFFSYKLIYSEILVSFVVYIFLFNFNNTAYVQQISCHLQWEISQYLNS